MGSNNAPLIKGDYMKRTTKNSIANEFNDAKILELAKEYNKAKASADKAKIQMSVPSEMQAHFIEALEQLSKQREAANAVGVMPYIKDGKKLGYTIRLSVNQKRGLFISSNILDNAATKQELIEAIKGIK